MVMSRAPAFGWGAIVRLGLVQACLGSVVVMTTSTLNRVMVVELALPAIVPGLLVALHYALQLARPRMGHGSDVGGRRTPWIIGGQVTLAVGGVVAAMATAWMGTQRGPGLALAALGFTLIGLGVSACGTSLLVLLAKRVEPNRRAAAATVVWVMMIMGFAVTAGFAGKLLDPYSPARLVAVMAGVSTLAVLITLLALWRLEGTTLALGRESAAAEDDLAVMALARSPDSDPEPAAPTTAKPAFREAVAQVWADADARRFTVFVFISMLAYSAQDLILEPFAGVVFGFTPGQSTSLSGLQHGGVLAGMLLAGLAGNRVAGRSFGSLKTWTVAGCVASALAMMSLVVGGLSGPPYPFTVTVFVLGMANGAFSIAAIGSMMRLAGAGGAGREGVRMGLWGAAQAIAFGMGGFLGTVASDAAQAVFGSAALAYSSVFALEAVLFVAAAVIAITIREPLGLARAGGTTASAVATASGMDLPAATAARGAAPGPLARPL
jgi:MFS transporter, BCD family, chlorophyll transporter